jgi:hypothetical protein
VAALAKRKVLARVGAGDVEAIRGREPCLVVVGGAEVDAYHRPGRDRDAAELHRPRRDANIVEVVARVGAVGTAAALVVVDLVGRPVGPTTRRGVGLHTTGQTPARRTTNTL